MDIVSDVSHDFIPPLVNILSSLPQCLLDVFGYDMDQKWPSALSSEKMEELKSISQLGNFANMQQSQSCGKDHAIGCKCLDSLLF